jgi:riboflavin kinase/FMN adenylyltransferase
MTTTHGTEINLAGGCAATIGKFEGLHVGHQALMRETAAKAKSLGLPSLVLTFTPRPASVLEGADRRSIFSDEEKETLIEEAGIDILVSLAFDEAFAATPPEAFEKLLFEKLKCKAVITGANFSYGKGGAGSSASLKEAGKAYGCEILALDWVLSGDGRASSSRIREAIGRRDFRAAEALMGRPYFVGGRVSHGKELGRTIGFPTINIIPPPDKLLPANGVYVTKTLHKGTMYESMTNVGVNPTVGGAKTTVETYLRGFDGCVYGDFAQIFFVGWIREEARFDGLESLKAQLQSDSAAMRRHFAKEGGTYAKNQGGL